MYPGTPASQVFYNSKRKSQRLISLKQFTELAFKRRFLTFLNDNRNYFPDLKFNVSLENASRADLWNGGFEITASRASFQHCELENTTIQGGPTRFNTGNYSTCIPYAF